MIGVAVFLKYPEPGKVKTRLARSIGEARAAEFYSEMLSQILEGLLPSLNPRQFTPVLYCDPFRPLEDYHERFGSFGYRIELQQGGDLGERLKNGFAQLHQDFEHAMAIGTDCLSITSEHFEKTRSELQSGRDLVLGPAEDGGYYLIATSRYTPVLFDNIEWSSEKVLSQTLKRASGLSTHQLETLVDIDTIEQLNSHLHENPSAKPCDR